ncbi:MAG TPA: hypothetical protein VLH39_01370 [Magnetospirillaceae bacterium]|nr:hypothetical protein [Magnetospirillaceae bacterium]
MIVLRTGGPVLRTRLTRILPKDWGSGDDRMALREDGQVLALCDGASEGWDGAGWAEALALTLCRIEDPERAVEAARAGRRSGIRGDGWLESAARARGSWSTALAVRLEAGGRRVAVSAVGDTVLFILDGCRPVASFPLDDPGAFGSTPDLVAENGTETDVFARAEFSLAELRRPRIALLTDALAARALSEPEAGRAALWAFLLGSPEAAFRAWARAEIEAGRLRLDDLSLLAAV